MGRVGNARAQRPLAVVDGLLDVLGLIRGHRALPSCIISGLKRGVHQKLVTNWGKGNERPRILRGPDGDCTVSR